MWRPGDLLRHRFNPDLGPGRVSAVDGRFVDVVFPGAGERLRMSGDADALEPLQLDVGTRVDLGDAGEGEIAEQLDEQGRRYELSDGRVVEVAELWPLDDAASPLDELASARLAPLADLVNRLEAHRLTRIREESGFGSFLGGRIRLFPHQLYVAERATRGDPVRWLLADEVGLGKTVEACLVLNHLVRARAAERTLVVAPETLVVQWLGELYRKYHQVFVLLDSKRLGDVARDLGEGFNPFDAHPQAVISLELLAERPELTRQACEAGIDLLVVDEAHHLERPLGHPGNPAYRAVAPIAALGRHALLLTATPLEEDTLGFFRLLELLRPGAFDDFTAFHSALERGDALPPCTSSTRRADIGGFPPRTPMPVDLAADAGFEAWAALEERIARVAARNPVERARRADLYRRVLSGPAAVPAPPGEGKREWRERTAAASLQDPRIAWLLDQAPAWRERGEKTLVFVAYRESLEAVQEAFEKRLGRRVAVFHEQMATQRRDIEVAQFRDPGGPSVLVSTECGGEGRNFEFCKRIVLLDLPWHPMRLEQRIGRLDRIGREGPVEIVYFRPPSGFGATVARVAEESGVFREPLGGLSHELARVEAELEEAACGEDPMRVDADRFAEALAAVHDARGRVEQAAYRELHREPYVASMADELLARVPEELEELTRSVVLGASEALGLDVIVEPGPDSYSITIGAGAVVDSLPGVTGGRTFLGTFSRAHAVEQETLDFFATGHPLVEGLMLELADGVRGRAGAVALELDHPPDRPVTRWGMLALYAHPAEIVVLDEHGVRQPDWEHELAIGDGNLCALDPEGAPSTEGWVERVAELAARLPRTDRPEAVALFHLR